MTKRIVQSLINLVARGEHMLPRLIGILTAISIMTSAHATKLSFNDSVSLPQWAIVNDTVMGGRSNAEIKVTAQHHEFAGSVSLENNGGFASVRYLVGDTLPMTDRVSLRVKGDGKLYQLRFRMKGAYNSVAYSVSFQTVADEWQTFTFLTNDFQPVWRGRMVRGAPELDLNNVQILSVFVSDKQTGPFQITLDELSFFDSASLSKPL